MTDTILSLSLLSGQLKAVAVRRGTVTGTWERPGTLEDFSTFSIVLLAAETGGTTTVLIGRKDGEIYLGRTLNSSWNIYPDRVNVDLNRTILYVKQQFGESVGSICLFGKGAEEHLRVMQASVKVPVALSPTPPSPFYWNEEVQKLPNDDTNNLVSAELLQAPQRRRLVKVTGLIIGLAALGAVATAVMFQLLVMDRRSQMDKLQPKVEKLLT